MGKKKLIVVAEVGENEIKKAEQVLIDNGIDKDEADAVLQAIGYVLLDTELYGNEVADNLHNKEAIKKFIKEYAYLCTTKEKDMKKMYVTYHWLKMFGNRSNIKAIECASKEQVHEVASDVASLHGIRNVRINYCGRIPKHADVISYEQYKSGEYYNM